MFLTFMVDAVRESELLAVGKSTEKCTLPQPSAEILQMMERFAKTVQCREVMSHDSW